MERQIQAESKPDEARKASQIGGRDRRTYFSTELAIRAVKL